MGTKDLDFDFQMMERSSKKIRKMRSDIIEITITIESMLDSIIIRCFDIENEFSFRIDFLYGDCPISLRKKISFLRKIKDGKYKALCNKLGRIEEIRNHFAHSPSGGYEYPVIISKTIKVIKAEEEFKEFNRLSAECFRKLSEINKELKEHNDVLNRWGFGKIS